MDCASLFTLIPGTALSSSFGDTALSTRIPGRAIARRVIAKSRDLYVVMFEP